MATITPIIKIMQDAAHKAGRSLLRDFGEIENLQVSQKGPGDFVSNADHKAEKIIIAELQKARPDYSILSEEAGEIKGKDESSRWIIDPLDGTKNFLHSVPQFCISIGLEQTTPIGKKEIVAGVIYVPVFNEVYWAERGQGSYVNQRRLLVSGRKKIGEVLLGTGGIGTNRDKQGKTKEVIRQLIDKGANVRMLGCAALELAYVAAGKMDGLWHTDLKSWDMAAGILIVREAKGMVTELNGGGNMLESGTILATNANMHEELQKIMTANYSA